MKKRVKRLSLAKETIRGLETSELRNPVGGVPTELASCPYSCKCTQWLQCNPSNTTCNSQYC